jgi:hypothetical protein
MGEYSQPEERRELADTGSDPETPRASDGASSAVMSLGLESRFRWALGLYAVLGLMVWFTMGEGKVLVHGRLVEMRMVPLLVIGGLVLRTVVARHAERIRLQDGKGSSSL